MPTYLYKATELSGNVVEGSLEAAEEKSVIEKLHDLGLIPIRIHLPKETQASSVNISFGAFSGRITPRDVLIFTQELSTLIEAGLPLDRSLKILVELSEKRKLQEVIQGILKSIEQSAMLFDGLAGQLIEGYRQRWQPLLALIERARDSM